MEAVSQNYALAVQKIDSRNLLRIPFIIYMTSQNIKAHRPSTDDNSRVLATLADVSLAYISQLLSDQKLVAKKVKGNWQIDAVSALEWLQSRKNCLGMDNEASSRKIKAPAFAEAFVEF